jgi:hypothetical protein
VGSCVGGGNSPGARDGLGVGEEDSVTEGDRALVGVNNVTTPVVGDTVTGAPPCTLNRARGNAIHVLMSITTRATNSSGDSIRLEPLPRCLGLCCF